MTSGEWYCRFDGEESGPFSADELEYLVRRDQLTRETEMRREGTGHWIPAERVPGLFPPRPAATAQPRQPAVPAEVLPDRQHSKKPGTPLVTPPEILEVAPPPIPKNGPPVGRGILAGTAALLALLLLAMLFWHGDGGKGSAKGSGGKAAGAGVGSGSGSEGRGTAGNGNAGSKAAGRGQGGNATAPKGAAGRSNSSQDRSDASTPDSSENSNPVSEQPDSPGGRQPESPAAGRETESTPSSDGRSAAEKDRKPIPKMVDAVVFEGDKSESAQDEDEGEESGDDKGASGGPGSEGTFFGITAKGRKFVYIVDRSGSMSGGRFARAREELIRSVKDLTDTQSFYVFFFNDDTLPMFNPPEDATCRATPENLQRLETWVHSVRSAGGTDPADALQQALRMRPDAVFLLSDGEIPGPISQMLQALNTRIVPPSSKSKRTRPTRAAIVTVNTIGFENTAGEGLLKRIAAENDGEYRFIPANVSPYLPGLPFP